MLRLLKLGLFSCFSVSGAVAAQDWFSMQTVNTINSSNQAIAFMNDDLVKNSIRKEEEKKGPQRTSQQVLYNGNASNAINGTPFFTTSPVARTMHLNVLRDGLVSKIGGATSANSTAQLFYGPHVLNEPEQKMRALGLAPNNIADVYSYFLVSVWKFVNQDTTQTPNATYRAVRRQAHSILATHGVFGNWNSGVKQYISEELLVFVNMMNIRSKDIFIKPSNLSTLRHKALMFANNYGFDLSKATLTPTGFVSKR